MKIITLLILLFTSGCSGRILVQNSYIKDYSNTSPFLALNGLNKNSGEGLEASNSFLGFEFLNRDIADLNFQSFIGPSLIAPNAINQIESADSKRDSLAPGVSLKSYLFFPRVLIFNPFVSLQLGAHYSHEKWDGQSTHYLFSYTPEIGLRKGPWYFSVGITHYSNGGGNYSGNVGRNAQIFSIGYIYAL